ncbi:glycosyltransferase [Acidiphilium iwatense]|uniref:Glycosyltransferase n=1 Tax=Acidiphilium iwatense TaxID=768198 RepID=A0ABS9DZH3_9PROT|nr:glycosyltransferase [Acidiphilium iwatense]MCF3948169.1 glycosyltransferase [Acidiphilium iwatense]
MDGLADAGQADEPIPSYVFDRHYYINKYVDIREIVKSNHSFDVAKHFWDYGVAEGRRPSLQFDLQYVVQRLTGLLNVRITGGAAIKAYFDLPAAERFVPNGWFSPWAFKTLYKSRFQDIPLLSDYALFVFYLERAAEEGISPSGLFSEEEYRATHPDIAAAIAAGRLRSGFDYFAGQDDPVTTGTLPYFDGDQPNHAGAIRAERDFILSGQPEIGARLWWFDENFYLTVYPDAHALKRQGAIRSGLEHFMVLGDREGRLPHPALMALAERSPGTPLRKALAETPRPTSRQIRLDRAAATAAFLYDQPNAAPRPMIDEALWRSVEPPAVQCTVDTDAYLKANPDLVNYATPKALAGHWRTFGLREQRLTPGTNLFGGRRLHLEDLGFWQTGGVNLLGALSASSGLGAAARGYRDAMIAAGIMVDEYDVSGATRPGGVFDLFDPQRLRFGYNFICLNPDHIATLLDRYGSALFDRRVNIGAWVWEMPVARPEWNAVLGAFDLIITPSEFCKQAFAAITERAIEVVPYVVDRDGLIAERERSQKNPWIERIQAIKHGRRQSDKSRIIVLFVMDASSYTARKGIDVFRAVATRLATEAPDEFLFVLKTHSRDTSGSLIHDMPANTLVIDAVFDSPDLVVLKSFADLYFSPHRSEGFGLNIFESLVLGVPALVSDYAGARELLGEGYPLLIQGRPVEVGAELGPYRANAIWFEPDIEAIVDKLHEFQKRDASARTTMAELCGDLSERLSAASVGKTLRGVLERRCAFGVDLTGFLPVIASPRDELLALPHVTARNAPPPPRVAEELVRPAFSIVTPTHNTETGWLEDLYADLCAQTVTAWEWCVADDGSTSQATIAALHDLRKRDSRIRIVFGDRNGGISAATNQAVMISSAPYVVMVDHDDRLAPGLLAAYDARIRGPAPPDLCYCDEDKILPDGRIGDHYFKPDFAPEHLMSVMYVLHCLCVRKSTFLELGCYRPAYDGAQDHDFALRAASAGASFEHVPSALYHWRMADRSAAASAEAKPQADSAGRRAVAEHLQRLGVRGTVEPGAFTGSYRVRPVLPDEPVTLLMLTRFAQGYAGGARVCYAEHFIDTILRHDPGIPFRLMLVIDEGGEAMANVLAKRDRRIDILTHRRGNTPFNFAAKANFAIASAATERIVLLNDDMEALDAGWLEAILEPLELPGVGIAGGRLLYPDDTVQHAGIVLGLNGAAGHVFVGANDGHVGYNGFTHVMRNYSAVTGAFMAFTRTLFNRVGGFDEHYPIDYNDVDFCLRSLESGARVVYTPFARLRHFESRSAPRIAADALDTERFSHRWRAMIERDPYYNPNLSRHSVLCEAAAP